MSQQDDAARDRAKWDQGTAFLADCLPPFWRRFFTNLKDEGFTEQQAMTLLLAYIFQGASGGINFPEQ